MATIAPPAPAEGDLTASVRQQLAMVERTLVPAAQAALVLADRIDRSVATDAGLARMVEVLLSTLDRALEGAKVEPDLVDQMQERRDAKRDRAAAG